MPLGSSYVWVYLAHRRAAPVFILSGGIFQVEDQSFGLGHREMFADNLFERLFDLFLRGQRKQELGVAEAELGVMCELFLHLTWQLEQTYVISDGGALFAG